MPLSTIFQVLKGADPDALSQTQREAMVDMLLWMMHADGNITAEEQETLETKSKSLRWDSVTPLKQYVGGSVAKYHKVEHNAAERQAYLQDIVARLKTEKVRQKALDAVTRLAKADNDFADEEQELVKNLQAAIKAASSN